MLDRLSYGSNQEMIALIERYLSQSHILRHCLFIVDPGGIILCSMAPSAVLVLFQHLPTWSFEGLQFQYGLTDAVLNQYVEFELEKKYWVKWNNLLEKTNSDMGSCSTMVHSLVQPTVPCQLNLVCTTWSVTGTQVFNHYLQQWPGYITQDTN